MRLHHYYGQSTETDFRLNSEMRIKLPSISQRQETHEHLFWIYATITAGRRRHLLTLAVEVDFSLIKIERISFSTGSSSSYTEARNINDTGPKIVDIGSISLPINQPFKLQWTSTWIFVFVAHLPANISSDIALALPTPHSIFFRPTLNRLGRDQPNTASRSQNYQSSLPLLHYFRSLPT